jgi:Tfp pilus assembly protein PilN
MELIPKQTLRIPKWLDILFYVSLVLLLVSFIGYLVLGQLIKSSQNNLDQLNLSLKQGTAQNQELEKSILNYQKKIKDFSSIISNRSSIGSFFELFQGKIHPKVWFNELSLDPLNYKASLNGQTQSFESLGQQMLIFRGDKMIQEVELKGVLVNEKGGIDFSLSLTFEPQAFK